MLVYLLDLEMNCLYTRTKQVLSNCMHVASNCPNRRRVGRFVFARLPFYLKSGSSGCPPS